MLAADNACPCQPRTEHGAPLASCAWTHRRLGHWGLLWLAARPYLHCLRDGHIPEQTTDLKSQQSPASALACDLVPPWRKASRSTSSSGMGRPCESPAPGKREKCLPHRSRLRIPAFGCCLPGKCAAPLGQKLVGKSAPWLFHSIESKPSSREIGRQVRWPRASAQGSFVGGSCRPGARASRPPESAAAKVPYS